MMLQMFHWPAKFSVVHPYHRFNSILAEDEARLQLSLL